ncbi:MAG: hypothetical protein IPK19_27035 [Chloroflexi bacterium]|nr:hypothetical protein [Chloroflexota bacterium]
MANLAAGFQSLPTEFQNAVHIAQERNRITITPLQALAGGWSGALIYLVSVAAHHSDSVQHLVLKLDRKNEKSQSDEFLRHEAALRQSPPGFAEQHMARMAFERVEADGVLAIFYAIAGQSLHRYKTLSSYETQSQVEAIFAATYQHVLDDWNVARSFEQVAHPTALLERWLSFRLKPGSNIEKFLETGCHIPPETAGFLVQGTILPNPLAYARHPQWWGTARPIDAAIGLQHGDLNTGNVLVRFGRDDATLDGYYLIDFALFKEQMPLVFDLRYLEMSTLILRQSQVSFARLVDLIVRLAGSDSIDPQDVPIDVAGVAAVIGTARRSYEHWVDAYYPSLHDDLWGQYWLAGAAAGLAYSHKASIPWEQRLAGLLYAAANLNRYCSRFGLTSPAEARQLFDPAQLSQSAQIAARSVPNNLPAQVTTLIGREVEAAAVRDLLAADEVRLVTLTGPGGVGKTRLSLEVAAGIRDSFVDGVFFIPLADITDPERVVSRIAQTMQVREGGAQPLIETVKGFLRDKSVLLVLDNFEQVAAAAPIITDLLTASARLKVLVTSRVTLQVTGEHELAVPPLALPKPARMPDLERLGKNESIRLFVERAQAVNSKFALTEENATAVAEICERLDGLPLAIELAAARTKLLPPQAMLSRLDHRLELLTGGARDLPLRQQSLRNSLDLSYSLLRPEEQTLLARLGVFGGGCTLEAAEAICNADGSLDLLEGLSSLINNSLLRPEDGAEGQPRFRMLESIREYALERLEQRAELAALQKAHAYYFFSTIASDASTKLYTRESLVWLNWLESEHANIDAALTWGLSNASAAELVSSVIYELTWYWYRRGYLNEGADLVRAGAELSLAGESTAHRAWALLSSMVLAIWQGDLNTALARGEAGLELARQLEDSNAAAMGLMNLGVANINRGHDATAYEPLKQAEAMFRTTGNAFFYPVTLVHLGNISLGLGNPAEARDWLEKAHAASRSRGEGWVESFVLNNLGEVARGR